MKVVVQRLLAMGGILKVKIKKAQGFFNLKIFLREISIVVPTSHYKGPARV